MPPVAQSRAERLGSPTGEVCTLILAAWPGALHVRLDAAVQRRVERAARRSGITQARPVKRQRREDELRADLSIRLYGWDRREPTRYDLVLAPGRSLTWPSTRRRAECAGATPNCI